MFTVNNTFQRSLDIAKNIFFSSTLRVVLVFFLLVSSCTGFVVYFNFLTTTETIVLMVLNGTICVHHWVGMILFRRLKIKPKFGSLVDFILLAAECTIVFFLLRPWTWNLEFYYMSSTILLSCAIWLETGCLCILLLIRFAVIAANVMDNPSAALAQPFDFFAKSNDDSNIDRLIHRLHPGLFSGYLRISSFRNHDGSQIHSHDHHWFLFLLRSTGILVVAISLLGVLFTNLVLEPLQETGMPPLKLITTTTLPSDFEANNVNWRIIAVYFDMLNEESKLHDAIQVKALWNNESDANPQCNVRHSGLNTSDFLGVLAPSSVKVMEFGCPDGLSPAERETDMSTVFGNFKWQPVVNLWPDLLITVNFTTLGINSTSLSNYGSRTVLIVVGMHGDTADIVHNTVPIPLVPDAHLLGGVLLNVRYQYRNPKLASLGVFSSRKTYLTSFVPFLTPDPSLDIPRDNNTATLRLYLQPDTSGWRLSMDYRDKSILAGISSLGGFWTVSNGIFAAIFGTTLSWILLGSKPLSAFGLIHKIPKFKPALEDERKNGRYPNLLSDGQSDGGLLDYIHDHFINLGPFESNRAGNANLEADMIPLSTHDE